MNWSGLAIALIAVALVGCGVGRVITAPVRYVFHEPEPTPAANASDVTKPGQPVAVPSQTPTPHVASRMTTRYIQSAKPRPAANKTKPEHTGPNLAHSKHPVAKAVQGKP